MMEFEGTKNKNLWASLENAANNFIDFNIKINRADIQEQAHLILDQQICDSIKDCDFAIADLTTQNRNVFIEIGFARALHKPVILLASDLSQVPSDLSGRYLKIYNPNELDLLPQQLIPYFRGARADIVAARRMNLFDVKGYANRDLIDLNDLFSKAENNISILTTNLAYFVIKYDGQSLIETIKKALLDNKNLVVTILTLDPDSNFTNDRAKQLRRPLSSFREGLRKSLEKTSRLLKGFPSRCHINTYDDFPTQVTIIVDDTIINSTIALNTTGRENCNFMLNKDNIGADKSFINHFNALFGRSEPFRRKMGFKKKLPLEIK